MASGKPASFGELLRRYRLAAGLTQEELAERAGLSARGVQDLERGLRRSPHSDTTRRLAKALELGDGDRAELHGAIDIAASSARSATAAPARPLPTGTVTFLFTDVEGSTRNWEEHPDAMRRALARHDELIERLVESNDGVLVRPRGEGDSRFAVFRRASDAVAAALAIQRALHTEPWSGELALWVHMAVHTGEADLRAGDYYGSAVNRCARLRGLAHGGQTLVSQATCDLARASLPAEAELRDLGWHRLPDLAEPEHVYQLTHPDLASEFPPLKSLEARPHNLPIQLTSFIGREVELAEIQHLLSSTRLLTLTGAGGVGKTRLALEVAAKTVSGYPDGVWFVELAAVEEERLVAPAALAALGLREVSDQPALDTLAAHLRGRTALMVIDNCEHVLGAAVGLADAILHAGPGLRVLATSREPLGVTGELAWRVPSLAMPRDDGSQVPDDLVTYAAVRLFEARARLVRPDFSITPANARSVVQICRRLDGIPLALELAAARVRVLTTEEIVSRLDDMFRVLTSGSRTAPGRQQTLRASLDWSHGLLNSAEQALFRRLAIFAGGWSLDAAEAVCTSESIAKDDVLDLLTSLVDKSLVVAEETPQQHGHTRYRMLEPVRQYALEQLNTSGEADSIGCKHTSYFLALAEQGELRWRGPRELAWLARMECEHDNLRIVLRRTLNQGDLASNLLLCVRLDRFWAVKGFGEEGLRWLEDALAQTAEVPPDLRTRALGVAAHLAILRCAFDRLGVLVDLWLTAARELGDDHTESHAKFYRAGYLIAGHGDVDGGIQLLEECLAFERTRTLSCDLTDGVMMHLGWALLQRGDAPRARDLFARGVMLARSRADAMLEAEGLAGQGFIAHLDGDLGQALRLVRHALILVHELGHTLLVGFFLDVLAVIDVAQAQVERAGRLFGAAEAVLELIHLQRNLLVQGDLGPFHDRAVAAMRSGPEADRFMAALADGRRHSLEEAVAYALDDEQTKPSSPTSVLSRL